MAKYEVIYDFEDEYGKQTLSEEADTYEEAKEIYEDLRASDVYFNIQIVGMDYE